MGCYQSGPTYRKEPRNSAISRCFWAFNYIYACIKDCVLIDPTVGSGGMLIHSKQYVEEQGGDGRKLALFGQDDAATVWSICKMNMIMHDIKDGAFEDFWKEAGHAVNSVHTDMGIAEFAIKFTNLLAETLEPLGILDQFQCQGVFANWWEHSYTVREYTEIEQSVEGKETKVDVKKVICIKNVFKTISSEGLVASLVSDDKIASEHFADELEELHRLRDDAENAQADLMAYVASIEMETGDDDTDDGDEEKETKEPSVKEVEIYLKSLGTDEAKASLKQIAALKKEKNRLS